MNKKPSLENVLGAEETPILLDDIPDNISRGIGNDIENDYEIVREKLLVSIYRAEEVLTEAVKAMKHRPEPRMIEATSMSLKTLSDSSKILIDLHKQIIDIRRSETPETTPTISDRKGTMNNIIRKLKEA